MQGEKVEGEVVEDARTGEIVPKGSPELRPGILSQININQVGTLELEPKTIEVLEEKLDPNDVQIRPDGLVYLPWTWYNKRLNRAFGLLHWALIPQGSPMIKENGNSTLVVWLNWLVIKGVPVSMAGGEMSYQPSNYTMSYGDALEGARSNSLARNCKNLGMALELWDLEWVNAWKKEHAETYPNPNQNAKQKFLWRKKGSGSQSKPQNAPKQAQEDPQAKSEPPATPSPSETPKDPTEPSVEKFTGNQIFSNTDLVKKIAEDTKKPVVDVCKVLGGLENGKKFSVEEIVAKIQEGAPQ